MAVALTNYSAAIDALFARTAGHVKPGLGRTEALLLSLGDPHTRIPYFHVAGTNGKGSVCAMLDGLLRFNGNKVGRYTSPHLVDFRERIVVNGIPIPEAKVLEFLTRVNQAAELLEATFFEITTAMAFWYFAEQNVDVAVIETGLGGLHDATNVVTPVAAAVTNISLDHTEYLGTTLHEVATEKAGIFKFGRPAIIGEPRQELAHFLATKAEERGATPIVLARNEWRSWSVALGGNGTVFSAGTPAGEHRITTPLYGEHQARNALTAVATAWVAGGRYRVPIPMISKALERVRLPGRFQRIGEWVFDVAHNPAGARVLAEALHVAPLPRPVTALVGVLGDKDWQSMLDALAPIVDRFIITQPASAPAARSWDPMAAAMYANRLKVPVDLDAGFDIALLRAQGMLGTKVVTGSFHTVGDAMRLLGIDPLDAYPVAPRTPTR
jgi:dihydrofolate synthase/folylpolyglutamate synthase